MQCDIFEIDVFATGAFTGNPLAVIACAQTPEPDMMQRVAAWLNYSETTFLLPPADPGADYRVRIFTPEQEFDFAGHPTLGTARAWLELGGRPGQTDGAVIVVQECNAGLVPVRVSGEKLAFATPVLRRSGPLDPAELERIRTAFRLAPGDVVDAAWGDNGPGWRMVQLRDVPALRSLRQPPEPVKVGFVAMTGGSDPLYEVRAFSGGREDPVTGSLNGALAQWLRGRGVAPARYCAEQGRCVGRRGRVEIHDDGREIWVGGAARTRVRGTITLPPL